MVARSSGQNQRVGAVLTGILARPVTGLRDETPTLSGLTDEFGAFRDRKGETLRSRSGGRCSGQSRSRRASASALLVLRAAGDVDRLHELSITDRAATEELEDRCSSGNPVHTGPLRPGHGQWPPIPQLLIAHGKQDAP